MDSDSSLESVEELDLGTRKSSVQPYMYEPTRYATPSCSSDSEEDSESEQQLESEEENPMDPSEWCTCGSCGPMPTQRECKCCHNTNIVDGKVKIENIKCITEHEGFLGNCLNIHVLEASYYEFIQSEGLQHEPVHETYRYIAYRRFARWIYHILPKKDRRIHPSCVVTAIRKKFPSEQYAGFQYAQ